MLGGCNILGHPRGTQSEFRFELGTTKGLSNPETVQESADEAIDVLILGASLQNSGLFPDRPVSQAVARWGSGSYHVNGRLLGWVMFKSGGLKGIVPVVHTH